MRQMLKIKSRDATRPDFSANSLSARKLKSAHRALLAVNLSKEDLDQFTVNKALNIVEAELVSKQKFREESALTTPNKFKM